MTTVNGYLKHVKVYVVGVTRCGDYGKARQGSIFEASHSGYATTI